MYLLNEIDLAEMLHELRDSENARRITYGTADGQVYLTFWTRVQAMP